MAKRAAKALERCVYLCIACFDYEGCEVQGVYMSLTAARKHVFNGGDSQEIHRWKFDRTGVGEDRGIVDMTIPIKRKHKSKRKEPPHEAFHHPLGGATGGVRSMIKFLGNRNGRRIDALARIVEALSGHADMDASEGCEGLNAMELITESQEREIMEHLENEHDAWHHQSRRTTEAPCGQHAGGVVGAARRLDCADR